MPSQCLFSQKRKKTLFENLYRQFCESQFTDLDLVSGLTGKTVSAHCLILASAVPTLGNILRDHEKLYQSADKLTVVCPDVSLDNLKKIVKEIYTALISSNVITQNDQARWEQALGCGKEQALDVSLGIEVDEDEISDNEHFFCEGDSSNNEFQIEEVFSSSRSSKRKIEKRKIFDDFVVLTKKPKSRKIDQNQLRKKDSHRTSLPNQHASTLISSGNETFPVSTEKLVAFGETETSQIFCLEDAIRDDNLVPQELPYNIYAPIDVTKYFKSLASMKESMISGPLQNESLYFMASMEGVYMHEGCKPYLPLRPRLRDENPNEKPIIPDANFVGLFGLGVRQGVNLAMPLALVDDRYPQDRVCENLLRVIRHVTGSSLRHVIEFYPLKSFSSMIKHEKCLMYQQKYFDMTEDQRQAAFDENNSYQTTMDLNLSKINHCPMSSKNSVLAFRMTSNLDLDDIIDYSLVYGSEIDHLSVQTFFEVGKFKLAKVALTAIFFDLMSAFCKLSSPSNITSISYFKQILDAHYERLCSKKALAEVMRGPQLKDKDNKEKIKCPTCSQEFPLNTPLERGKYKEHQQKHTSCECNLQFSTDEEFQAHMKNTHSQKKLYNCTLGSCGKGFTKLVALKFHIDKFHRGEGSGAALVCDICGEAYLNKMYLSRHHYQAHRQAPCPGCEKVIDGGSKGMYQHRAKECPNNTAHLCSHCGQEFKMRVTLNNHIRLVHLASKESYPCSLCTKKFACKQRLIVHLEGVHNPVKKYPCRSGPNLCDAKFSTSASRKRHEIKKHTLDIRMTRGSPKTTLLRLAPSVNDTS